VPGPPLDKPNGARVIADAVCERPRAAILSAELRPNRRLVEEEIVLGSLDLPAPAAPAGDG
jgi:hypothetical protein